MTITSNRTRSAIADFEPVLRLITELYHEGPPPPGRCDFTFGNPHEMPLGGLVQAIKESAEPQSPDWFAYKSNEPEPREFLARRLIRCR
jgi:aspartate aminotransferase